MRNKILGTSNTKIVNSILIFLFCFYYNNHNVNGFYVPGVAPQDYKKDDVVDVKVIHLLIGECLLFYSILWNFFLKAVKLTSTKTQLPYEYYNLPIHCKPSGGVVYKSENLGEILRGDRIVNTGYKVQMNVNSKCRVLCKDVDLNEEKTKKVIKRIKDAYHVHL